MTATLTLIPCAYSPRIDHLADFAAGVRAIRKHGIPQILHLHPEDITLIRPSLQEPTSPNDADVPRTIVLPADRRPRPSTDRQREFLRQRDALIQKLRNSSVPESTAVRELADQLAALGYQPDGGTNGPPSFPEEHSATRPPEASHNPIEPSAPAPLAGMPVPLHSISPVLPSPDSTTADPSDQAPSSTVH